jgi:hypothetical protein
LWTLYLSAMPRVLVMVLHCICLMLGAGLLTVPLRGQNPTQTARAFVPSPIALGMGDAAVAFPSPTTAFFYNPAHLATTGGPRPRFEVSLQPGVTRPAVLGDHYAFLRDRFLPALREISSLSAAQRRALYDEAVALGQARTSGGLDGQASGRLRKGSLGLGGGLFARRFVRYQVRQGSVPEIALSDQTDLTALFAGAFDFSDFGMPGLALGATAKVQRRTLAFKDKPLDAFSADELLYVQQATATGLDLGATYQLGQAWLPGRLIVGAALFDVASTGFEYEFKGRTRPLGRDAPAAAQVAEIERQRALDEFELAPSYRLGLAYLAPSFFGVLGETGVTLGYQRYGDPGASRAFHPDVDLLSRLHVGAQVQMSDALTLRGGIGQGYPSAGAGVQIGPLRLDYAFYGQEDGRRPGQAPVWQHLLRFGVEF